jgi:hypothetical protein
MRAAGGHGVVRFDVFCGHCHKQLAEDVDADEIDSAGFRVDKPMDIYCDRTCARRHGEKLGRTLWTYGWTPIN